MKDFAPCPECGADCDSLGDEDLRYVPRTGGIEFECPSCDEPLRVKDPLAVTLEPWKLERRDECHAAASI